MKRITQGYLFSVILLAVMLSIAYWSVNDNKPQEVKKKKQTGAVETIRTNINGRGVALDIFFTAGEEHNHPLMAIWVEDTAGHYIQSLYVARSIATGVFNYGVNSGGKWEPGPVRRPAALPYWGHKRGIQAPDGLFVPAPEDPLPDAYTGATPKGDFVLETKTDENTRPVFRILFEINQSWDWNEFWTNNKYPDDPDYKTSSQPAVVYSVTVDLNKPSQEYEMTPIGHSHYSGQNGDLFTDLSTLTTALNIVDKIIVKIK